jgi:hypothetical protein
MPVKDRMRSAVAYHVALLTLWVSWACAMGPKNFIIARLAAGEKRRTVSLVHAKSAKAPAKSCAWSAVPS